MTSVPSPTTISAVGMSLPRGWDVLAAVVITRGGARRIDGKLRTGFSPDELVADCEGSLARLGREQIDVWLPVGA